MKKILIFSLVYYPRHIGGAEVAIKEITDRIAPSEAEFDMITLRKHSPSFEKIGNVNVHRVGMPWSISKKSSSKIFPLSKILYIPLAFFKAISLHKKNKYDLTWSMMASYAGFSAMFFKFIFNKVPFLLTLQEGDNFERRQGIFKHLFGLIFRKADKIQVISHFLEEWAKDMGAKCPITVVPNGVDFAWFDKPIEEKSKQVIRQQLSCTDSDILMITTSRLVKKNATDDIIKSLIHLPNNYKLVIIGSGPDRVYLHELTSKLNLNDRVFFQGFMPHSSMPDYLKSADIFVRPSLSEGFGNSFIEAMAAGIPVIATPVGGIVDFLNDGETGLFCDVNNPKSIALKAEKLAKDRESRDYIVKNAREMVRVKYDWGMVVEEMKEIF